LGAALHSMTDINSASLADIAAAGFDAALAREVQFWRPYRSWEQLLLVGGIDEAALEQLKDQGFEITAPDYAAMTPPKPFKLRSAPTRHRLALAERRREALAA
jgi:hypothetical protein